jgi:hypothetical protein
MGTPTSSTLAEIFIQHLEHIIQNLTKTSDHRLLQIRRRHTNHLQRTPHKYRQHH